MSQNSLISARESTMQWKMGKRRTEEDVPAVLYHGTGIRELLWILEADRLEALYSDGDGSPVGVSLTSKPYIDLTKFIRTAPKEKV